MILDTSDSNMPKKRPTFLYRRKHAEDFPYCCDTCVPELRFKLLRHKAQHDNDKHGIPIIAHESKKAAMISSLHAAPMSTSACTSPLSAVTMRELNTFIETEIEPDTEYNQSCNFAVDRLCYFMQNNFPYQLRPSKIQKVNLPMQK